MRSEIKSVLDIEKQIARLWQDFNLMVRVPKELWWLPADVRVRSPKCYRGCYPALILIPDLHFCEKLLFWIALLKSGDLEAKSNWRCVLTRRRESCISKENRAKAERSLKFSQIGNSMDLISRSWFWCFLSKPLRGWCDEKCLDRGTYVLISSFSALLTRLSFQEENRSLPSGLNGEVSDQTVTSKESEET